MPSKYGNLTAHLLALDADSWRPSFTDVERILGFPLPTSARQYPAWWSNSDNGSHSHVLSWMSAGFETKEVDIPSQRLTFYRVSKPYIRTSAPKQSSEVIRGGKCDWEVSNTISCEVELSWTHVGTIGLDRSRKLEFPSVPETPGLYRMRIPRLGSNDSRYVGEADNLRRRFQHYRTPGRSEKTSVRINQFLIYALEQGSVVALSIVTSQAWITQSGTKQPADLSLRAVRRLFENFSLLLEGDVAVEDLNR